MRLIHRVAVGSLMLTAAATMAAFTNRGGIVEFVSWMLMYAAAQLPIFLALEYSAQAQANRGKPASEK